MARLVQCKKLGRELPGLEEPPFAGELGQRIYESISAEAFANWQEQARAIIGAYRLNLAERGARDFLRQTMEDYFFGEGFTMPDWAAAGGPASPRK